MENIVLKYSLFLSLFQESKSEVSAQDTYLRLTADISLEIQNFPLRSIVRTGQVPLFSLPAQNISVDEGSRIKTVETIRLPQNPYSSQNLSGKLKLPAGKN